MTPKTLRIVGYLVIGCSLFTLVDAFVESTGFKLLFDLLMGLAGLGAGIAAAFSPNRFIRIRD
jgi:hypothetical protein